MNFAGRLTRPGALVQEGGVVPQQEEHAALEKRPGSLEGTARNQIDRTGQRAALRLRRRREGNLDARHVVDRHHVHRHEAPGAAAAAGADRARDAEAVDGDRDIIRRDAVDRYSPRVPARHVDGDARHELQELSDVSLRHIAKFVGGNDIFHVRREALLVDCQRGSTHHAGRRDHVVVQLDRLALDAGGAFPGRGGKLKITLTRAPGDHLHGMRLQSGSGEKCRHLGGARRDLLQAVIAVRVSGRLDRCPFDLEPNTLENGAGGGIVDPTFNGSRG